MILRGSIPTWLDGYGYGYGYGSGYGYGYYEDIVTEAA